MIWSWVQVAHWTLKVLGGKSTGVAMTSGVGVTAGTLDKNKSGCFFTRSLRSVHPQWDIQIFPWQQISKFCMLWKLYNKYEISPKTHDVLACGFSHRVQFFPCLKNQKDSASNLIWNEGTMANTGVSLSAAMEKDFPVGSSMMNGYNRLICGIQRLYARSCLLHINTKKTVCKHKRLLYHHKITDHTFQHKIIQITKTRVTLAKLTSYGSPVQWDTWGVEVISFYLQQLLSPFCRASGLWKCEVGVNNCEIL